MQSQWKFWLFGQSLRRPGLFKLRPSSDSREWLPVPRSFTTVFPHSTRRPPTRFLISSSLPPPLSPMKPWRVGCWSCSPIMISRGMKRSLTFLYPGTWSHWNSCPTCLLCFHLVTNHVSFSEEPFSRDCLPMFAPTCSGTISQILFLLPLKQTKYIKAESLLLMFTPFPAPQRISSPSTPLDHQYLIAPAVLLLLMPTAGRETSSQAGGCLYPSCRASYFISFSLFTRFTEFTEIPHWLWCFSISVPGCQVAYSRRFLSHMFWFLDNSSTIQDPQVQVAFPASSGSHSHHNRRFFGAF